VKWLKHDANAHTDTKLKKVKYKYGLVGYGLYWYCIELIAGNISRDNITFSLEDDSEIIAMDWNIEESLVSEILDYFVEVKLFEPKGKSVTCFKLAKRLDDSNSKNPEIKIIINKMEEEKQAEYYREDQTGSDSFGDIPTNSEKVITDEIRPDKNSLDQSMLDKKRKDEIKKEEKKNQKDSSKNELSAVQKKSDVIGIFEQWKIILNHPKAVLDDKRKRLIKSALKNYSFDDCVNAIKGCYLTPHNMGKNDNHKIYDGLHIIFKDSDNIERFINSSNPNQQYKTHVDETEKLVARLTGEQQ